MTSTSESRTPHARLAVSDIETGVWYRLDQHLWIRACTALFLDLVLVELRGGFDSRNASVIERTFHEIIGLGATALHLDLADIESFDGAGARTLAVSAAGLEAQGGRLRVLNASGSVERVLQMTGLGRLLIASSDAQSSVGTYRAVHDDASTRAG